VLGAYPITTNYDASPSFHHVKTTLNWGRALNVGHDGNLHIRYCQHFSARTLSYKPYHGPVHTWTKGVPDWVLEHEEIRSRPLNLCKACYAASQHMEQLKDAAQDLHTLVGAVTVCQLPCSTKPGLQVVIPLEQGKVHLTCYFDISSDEYLLMLHGRPIAMPSWVPSGYIPSTGQHWDKFSINTVVHALQKTSTK